MVRQIGTVVKPFLKFQKAFVQTFWQFLAKVITAGVGVVMVGLITRHVGYGEAGTGIYTLSTTFVFLFCIMSDFGFNAYTLPLFSSGNMERYWRKLLGLRLVLSLSLVLLALGIGYFWSAHSPLLFTALNYGLISIIAYALFNTAVVLFQYKFRYDFYFISVALGVIPALVLTVIAINNYLPIAFVTLGYALSWVVSASIALYLAKRFISDLSPLFDWTFIKQAVIKSWPIAATLLLNLVYFRFDSFYLASVTSFEAVGVYNLAYQIFQSILVLPTFATNALYPLFIKEFKEDKKTFKLTFLKSIWLMFIVSMIGTALTYWLAPVAIKILAGEVGFVGSPEVLRILGFSLPAFFVSAVCMWTLIVLNKYQLMLYIYLIGLLVNVVLNLLLIPIYSIYGAAIVTGISELIVLLLQVLVLIREFRRL